MIPRYKANQLVDLINNNPVVGLIGPRQVGKTTLVHELVKSRISIYIDLELPSDRAKLLEPELYLRNHIDKLVILDEIHRLPEVFQVLRSLVDQSKRQGKTSGLYLVLGSASIDLLRQSSESLAGRIDYLELNPFSLMEISPDTDLNELWLRGGFPESFLAQNEEKSIRWRQSFVRTYLEREIPQFGMRIPSSTLYRFWQMLANNQGGLFNANRFSSSLGVSGHTINRYLDLLVDLLLVRKLEPWLVNTSKRLVKSPKVYVRDSGIVHSLLGITNFESLLGHPVSGGSFEGFVIENITSIAPFNGSFGFYRSASGVEVDLIVSIPPDNLWAIEIKRSLIPKPEKGFHYACEEIKPTAKFIVYPGEDRFPVADDIEAISLKDLMLELSKLSH